MNQFARFAVPAFILITGFTLASSYIVKGHPFKYFIFLKQRIFSVLIPYILWSVSYYFFLQYCENNFNLWSLLSWELIKTLFLGTAAYHLYFIVLICQFYVLAPLFLTLYKKYPHPSRIITLGLFLQLIATIYNYHFVNMTGIPFIDALIQYLDRNFILWTGYFLIGMGLAAKLTSFRIWVERYRFWIITAILLTWTGLVLEFLYSTRAGQPFAGVITSVKPLVFFYTLSAIPILFWLQPKINSVPIRNFYTQISKYSFGMYLIHPLVIWWIQIILVNIHLPTTILVVFFSYIFCITLSYLGVSAANLLFTYIKFKIQLKFPSKSSLSDSSVPIQNPNRDFIA
jgi:peptidoglycan/LPS O-acetylase OafA/YrhL